MQIENSSEQSKIVFPPITITDKPIALWLLCGCAMIYLMIIIGGITRLTGSGLSIVEWNVVMGTLPPMDELQWNETFEKYKQFPQYKITNQEMTLSEFKSIFFWEYIHRLWGRLIGVVFIIPLIYFLFKKQISKPLFKKLIFIFLLGALQGFVGWFMVQSGLVDKPWVSPYRLTLHLFLALFLLYYVFWTVLEIMLPRDLPQIKSIGSNRLKDYSYFITAFILLQIFFGGLMSGMKAGLLYPTFPTMDGEIIPSPMTISGNWTWHNIIHYDESIFAPALIQFFHRTFAYIIALLIGLNWMWVRGNYPFAKLLRNSSKLFVVIIIIQIILGAYTIMGCKTGKVPIALATLHQIMAVLLLTVSIFNNYILYKGAITKEQKIQYSLKNEME